MSIDGLINVLLEAKEHCVDGRSEVCVFNGTTLIAIDDVVYANDKVTIEI